MSEHVLVKLPREVAENLAGAWTKPQVTVAVIEACQQALEASEGGDGVAAESMFTPDQQAEIGTGSVSGFAVGDVVGRKRLDTLRECEIAATAFAQGVGAEAETQSLATNTPPTESGGAAEKLVGHIAGAWRDYLLASSRQETKQAWTDLRLFLEDAERFAATTTPLEGGRDE